MSQPSDSFRLFHHLRDAAYSPATTDHPGRIDLDDEALATTLGLDPETTHDAIDVLMDAHLLERAADDRAGHEEVLVRGIDDLSALTVLLAAN